MFLSRLKINYDYVLTRYNMSDWFLSIQSEIYHIPLINTNKNFDYGIK